MEGHPEDIQRCIGCLNCIKSFMNNAGKGLPGECALNMSIGDERQYFNMPKDGKGRKVMVVGAGPAGLTAARTLAMRGYDVEVYEKQDKCGGQVVAASSGIRKERLYWAIEDLQTAAQKAGAKIFCGKEITTEEIRERKPFAVIIATGGTPTRPQSIPGINGENVIEATEILLGKKHLRDNRVVVVGSGMTGLETTEVLCDQGNRVVVIEMADEIAPGAWFQLVDDAMERIKPYGARFNTGFKLSSVEADGVVLESVRTHKVRKLECDKVVLAMGITPNNELYNELIEQDFINVFCVGDAQKSGTIADACHSAYGTVMGQL
jgi:NADPH-dependent 2,4-dienoyl-CoA reductase/sulfur reductase-like enzyme